MKVLTKEQFAKLISNIPATKIAVIGDVMLDTYLTGSASRISQEAPVPVVLEKNRTSCLGGAANVMRNITSFGGKVYAFGVVGRDPAGEKLLELLEKDHVDTSCIEFDQRKTTEKIRVLANSQQVVRIDSEDTRPISKNVSERICVNIKKLIAEKGVDAIIFEDYNKGVLSQEMMEEIVAEASAKGIFTSLDPHPGHGMVVKNLSLITPNRLEAFGLAGIPYKDPDQPEERMELLKQVAEKISEKWEVKNLLITLSAEGMGLFRKNTPAVLMPTVAREVFDVSGAGDTVIATYTLFKSCGATDEEAMHLSNIAAGIVVGRVGTVTTNLQEIQKSIWS